MINKIMIESFRKAEMEVILSKNKIVITKGNIVLLEIFLWHNKVIVRKQGKNDYYDALNAIWCISGKIWLRLKKDNFFLDINPCTMDGAG